MNKLKRSIKIPQKKNLKQIKQYFETFGIMRQLGKNVIPKNRKISKLINPWSNKTYGPELHDLYLLHSYIILNKRLTVLEFGSGWSIKVLSPSNISITS